MEESVLHIQSVTCSSYQVATQRSLQPADISIQEAHHQAAGHAMLCRVRVSRRGGAGPAPQHHEASHGALGSACLLRGGRTRAITTKARRHLSRAAREHLNGTLFDETEMEQEEPPEETDLILHDDDDDDDDVEDTESTGTVVAEAVVPFFLVASQIERGECFLLTSPLRVRQASTETLEHHLSSRRRGTDCVLASCRCGARVRPLSNRHELGGSSKLSNGSW